MKVSINAGGSHIEVDVDPTGHGMSDIFRRVTDMWRETIDHPWPGEKGAGPALGFTAERRPGSERFEWSMGEGKQPAINA